MNAKAVVALVRKDLKLFLSDRRAVVVTFITPIAIAAFFGFLFSGNGSSGPSRIPVCAQDLDQSPASKAILKGLGSDSALALVPPSPEGIREAVRKGKVTVGIVIPKGFGEAAGKAFFGAGTKPELAFLYDPSHSAELAMVRGILTQHVMEAVSADVFGGPGGKGAVEDALKKLRADTKLGPEDRNSLRDMLESVGRWQDRVAGAKASGEEVPAQGLSMPYAVSEEAVTAREGVAYNGYAHSFAGMGIQFILFAAVDLGVGILLERQLGLWKRLRGAPLSRATLLAGKTLSGAAISLMTLAVTMGFGMLVFGIRVQGSWAGFVAICLASALMAATFGLMLAALGSTPGATRGIAIFAVLLLVMLGGGWVPSFLFPAWLQAATLAVPTRWAVDGLDAMTWRGVGFSGAVAPTGVLLGFALLFGVVAVGRFRWELD